MPPLWPDPRSWLRSGMQVPARVRARRHLLDVADDGTAVCPTCAERLPAQVVLEHAGALTGILLPTDDGDWRERVPVDWSLRLPPAPVRGVRGVRW